MAPPSARAPRAKPKKTSAPKVEPAPAPSRLRSRLEVDARRAQLVTLGINLFASRSYDDVSIDELARSAGVSKGLLYHYFPTKRDFYIATVHEAAKQLLALTETSETMAPVERLRASLDAYLDYVDAHAPAYAALMRGGVGSDPEVAKIIDATRTTMGDRFFREMPEVPATPLMRTAIRGWLGFCEATSLEWIDKRAVGRDEVRDLMMGVLLATIPMGGKASG